MIDKKEIFLNESYWRDMSENEINLFIDKIFTYYRENGFPFYPTDKETRIIEFNKLIKYNYINLFKNDIIGQSMHGLNLAWSYFPHAFNVKCNNLMTPFEAFSNDDIFKNVIRKRLKMGTYMSDSGIRKMLKIYTGVQSVSNFRPTAAACIYKTFANNGVVWDMSGGWGGRMLGAIIGGVSNYIATEPSLSTYYGLHNLANDFAGQMKWNVINCGSEEYKPDKNTLDLCFTSPPYFDLEKYSNDASQSYIKFKTKKEWIDGFLSETFINCRDGLKNNGNLIINIADNEKKYNLNLEQETIKTAEKIGFKLVKKFYLALSNINLKNKNNKFKYEPIYLFVKWKF